MTPTDGFEMMNSPYDRYSVLLAFLLLPAIPMVAQPCTGAGGTNLNPTLFSPTLPTSSAGCTDCPAQYVGEVNAGSNVPMFMCFGRSYVISLCTSVEIADLTVSVTTGPPAFAPVAVFYGADFDDDGCGMVDGLPAMEFSPAANGIYYMRIREDLDDDPCVINTGITGILTISCNIPSPPENDEACDAIELVMGDLCAFQDATTAWSTGQFTGAVPSCGGEAQYFGDDVWFQVAVAPSGELAISTELITAGSLGMAVYQPEDCGVLDTLLAEVGCANGGTPILELTGLDPDLPAYIRVWHNQDISNMGTFRICAYDPIMLGTVQASGISSNGLRLFPNPANDQVVVSGARPGDIVIVRDMAGRELKRNVINSKLVMDVGDMAAGVYLVTMASGGSGSASPLVIRR